MKTTIDLPDALLHRAKVAAAQGKTTLMELVLSGLEIVLSPGANAAAASDLADAFSQRPQYPTSRKTGPR